MTARPRAPGADAASRQSQLAQLEVYAEALKEQQALVRSCISAEADPDALAQMNAVLRLLTEVRRRHRILVRVWRGIPTRDPPADLEREFLCVVDEIEHVDALVDICRTQVIGKSRMASVEAWTEFMNVAQHYVANYYATTQ